MIEDYSQNQIEKQSYNIDGEDLVISILKEADKPNNNKEKEQVLKTYSNKEREHTIRAFNNKEKEHTLRPERRSEKNITLKTNTQLDPSQKSNLLVPMNKDPRASQVVTRPSIKIDNFERAVSGKYEPPLSQKMISDSRRGSFNAIAPNYLYYKKLYGVHKDPIQSFLNNFSRSLLFTINRISADSNSDRSPREARTKHDKKALASFNTNTLTTDKMITDNKLSIKEIAEESLQISEDNTQIEPSPEQNLIVKSKTIEKSPIAITREKFEKEDKELKEQIDRENMLMSKKSSKFTENVSKVYTQQSIYAPVDMMKSFSIIKKDSSSSLEMTDEEESDSEEDRSDDSQDSISSDKDDYKLTYLRSSALYEAEHISLVSLLAKSIFETRPAESIKIELMKNLTNVFKENSDIDTIIKHLRVETEGLKQNENENNEEIQNKLKTYKNDTIERYLFFSNENPNFNQENTTINEKYIIENESDLDNMKRILMKKQFLENSKIKENSSDEFAYVQIIPTEECIIDKFDLDANPKLQKRIDAVNQNLKKK